MIAREAASDQIARRRTVSQRVILNYQKLSSDRGDRGRARARLYE